MSSFLKGLTEVVPLGRIALTFVMCLGQCQFNITVGCCLEVLASTDSKNSVPNEDCASLLILGVTFVFPSIHLAFSGRHASLVVSDL